MKLPGDLLGPLGVGALQGAVRGAGRMSDDQAAASIRGEGSGAPVRAVGDSHAEGMRIAPALARGDTAEAKRALLSSVAHATAHLPDESTPGLAEGLAGGGHDPAAPSAYDRALAGLLLLAHPQAWMPDRQEQELRAGKPAAEGP
jgi:hypothetical protein